MKSRKINKYLVESKNISQVKDGFILIDEIESHLHTNSEKGIIEIFINKIFRKDKYKKTYTVSVFVASGTEIDKKMDKLNQRIQKKQKIH